VELSDERARTVADSGVRVVGDAELLRYSADPDSPELGEPPAALPTDAAAQAIEHALAGMLKTEEGRARRRATPPPARPLPDPLSRLSSRAMLREVARRQAARLRRTARRVR